jgi:hypothetical protein
LEMIYASIMPIAIIVSITCVSIFISHQHHWSALIKKVK